MSSQRPRGFFEKMVGPLPGHDPRSAPRWVGEPVRDHLTLLLNTRRGSVPNLDDYGMPDVSSFYSDYPASLTELRSEVERLIMKYEPRLGNVKVRLIESEHREFRVALLITGEIEEEGEPARVQYRTTFSSDGHAELSREDEP